MLLTALFHTACLSTPALSAAPLRAGAGATQRKKLQGKQKHYFIEPLLDLSPAEQRFDKGGADTCVWFVFSCLFVCVFGWMSGICCWINFIFCSPPGRSSLFPIDDNLLDDGHGNQGVPGVLGSPNCYPHQNGERIERFSRKVFVGGLPPDIDEGEDNYTSLLLFYQQPLFCLTHLLCLFPSDEITSSFRRFGHLVVDWPHKAESKSYFPPKGTNRLNTFTASSCGANK